jgi:hypothetical protein
MITNTRLLIALLALAGAALLVPVGTTGAQEPIAEPAVAEPPATATAPETAAEPESDEQSTAEPLERETVRRRGDLVSIFNDHIEVPAHVEQWGNIVCIGGKVTIEGKLRGEVVVINGDAVITGRVTGSVVGVLSNLSLTGARIDDQLVNVAGTLQKESTDVDGQLFNMGFGTGTISLARTFGVLGAFLFWARLCGLLVIFVVLLLLAATVPERIRRIAEETPNRIFAAFFVGLLAYLAYWILLLLLLATVVGFFVVLILFFVLKWIGIAGMFHWFGQRVGRGLGREMSLLGAILLGFAPYALIILAPSAFGLVGFVISCAFYLLIWLFLEIPAVGLFILTRAGAGPRPASVVPASPIESPPAAWSASGDGGPAETAPDGGAPPAADEPQGSKPG